ncbi:S9 family peptidase [Chromobacterium sp. ATCC 53434]|uniref:alpha/beta hydrolase family protein n=1 Tax=Chromobacterium sp. (strain ATCC 53434 / SC 14030) TaxID=2059672 RepID=UPI000C7632C2|nr:prolyl oligopeptidase family serine peptidase [Chromobacterium sp. ATCC 53434]AUH51521.1 S9 family peptidase [Chromobacterium sp. ATCC 53434]
MSTSRILAGQVLAALAACALPVSPAQAAGYQQPPANILKAMRAPALPGPSVSPTRDRMLLVAWQEYPSIARVAAPFLRLAGTRVEPANRSKHDTPGGYGIAPCAESFKLVSIPDGRETAIALPAGACPDAPIWSADGKRFAFANTTADAVELWVGDAASGKIRKVPGIRLNPMLNDELQWMPDQKTLLVKAVPAKLGPPPAKQGGPDGPNVQEADGEKGQSSTYETRDTLSSPHDEALFDYYAASQLTLVDAASGKTTPLGQPALYDGVGPAPDGKHILVSSVRKPYSYVTTYERFPHQVEVWDVARPGRVGVHTVASLPLADRVPVHGEPLGPRDFFWRATEPATLLWAEALDGGDWQNTVPARDKVMMQKAPFTAAPVEILRTAQRFAGLDWSERADTALLSEVDLNKHWRQTRIVNIDDAKQPAKLLWDLSFDNKYADPGSPVHRTLASGERVIQLDGDAIYLAGGGASPQGNRPFLDKLDLKTLQSQRLFRSDKSAYERFIGLSGGNGGFLTWRQTPTEAPNAFLRTLGQPVAAGQGEAAFSSTQTAVTRIVDPTPELRQIKKRLVKYKRADGLDLSFTLYTPPGYQEGTRVPAILNAYPLDYADAASAGQVSGSQQTFTRLYQYKYLLLAGYAVIDQASFPVVGDPKAAYDTYLDQLKMDAEAAVGEAVKLGVVDPDRVAVTGHSHGALMTANLLAHTDLFRAGAATSGSYNKTLTPFGFQSERRSVWEAPDVYRKVSTFFYADKLKTPILIVHGSDDANPGTTPLQASKFYEAIRGNGGTARLVMLPHEPHWYAARESNEQLVYEMLSWFDKYVKNAPPRAVKTAQSQPAPAQP